MRSLSLRRMEVSGQVSAPRKKSCGPLNLFRNCATDLKLELNVYAACNNAVKHPKDSSSCIYMFRNYFLKKALRFPRTVHICERTE